MDTKYDFSYNKIIFLKGRPQHKRKSWFLFGLFSTYKYILVTSENTSQKIENYDQY